MVSIFFYFRNKVLLFIFFFLVMATPAAYGSSPEAYGSSQTGGQIRAAAASPHNDHSNAGSLTHWTRPGIKPTLSWRLVRFITYWATTGTPCSFSLLMFLFFSWHPFPPNSNSFRGDLLAVNFLGFYLHLNVFILPSFLKDIFTGYRNSLLTVLSVF